MHRILVVSMLAAVAACAESPSEPRTSTETSDLIDVSTDCGCVEVIPTAYTNQTNFWPNNAKGVVYVVSSNAAYNALHPNDPPTFLAFGFVNQGYNLAWTYQVPFAQYGTFIGAVQGSFASHMVQNNQGSVGAIPDVWSGGGGGLDGPGPGGGGTGGPPIPHGYIARMQRTAATIIDTIRMAQHADAVGNVAFGQ